MDADLFVLRHFGRQFVKYIPDLLTHLPQLFWRKFTLRLRIPDTIYLIGTTIKQIV